MPLQAEVMALNLDCPLETLEVPQGAQVTLQSFLKLSGYFQKAAKVDTVINYEKMD